MAVKKGASNQVNYIWEKSNTKKVFVVRRKKSNIDEYWIKIVILRNVEWKWEMKEEEEEMFRKKSVRLTSIALWCKKEKKRSKILIFIVFWEMGNKNERKKKEIWEKKSVPLTSIAWWCKEEKKRSKIIDFYHILRDVEWNERWKMKERKKKFWERKV